MSSSVTVVFTAARFSQRRRVPAFCPAMPPVYWVPRMTPETRQSWTVPSLYPAMPPTAALPTTTPEKAQFSMLPAFSPAMPPMRLCSPEGVTSASTVRSLTAAPVSTRLKRP